MKSKLLALSAISAAFSAILLTVGTYLSMADLFCLIMASAFVMLPLYYNSFKAASLSFLVGGVVAFIFSGFNITVMVVPAYFFFFGSYPILKFYAEKKGLNKYLTYALGSIWCLVAVFGIYFFYVNVTGINFNHLPKFVNDYMLIFVGIVGCVFYVVYERYVKCLKNIIDFYLRKFIK